MRNNNNNNRRRKHPNSSSQQHRQHRHQEHEEELVVDDLEFASQYANVVTSAAMMVAFQGRQQQQQLLSAEVPPAPVDDDGKSRAAQEGPLDDDDENEICLDTDTTSLSNSSRSSSVAADDGGGGGGDNVPLETGVVVATGSVIATDATEEAEEGDDNNGRGEEGNSLRVNPKDGPLPVRESPQIRAANQQEESSSDDGDSSEDDDEDSNHNINADLEERIRQLVDYDDEDDDDEAGTASASRPPTTANEVDAYRSSTKQLEAALSINLTIDEELVSTTTTTNGASANPKSAAVGSNAKKVFQPVGFIQSVIRGPPDVVVVQSTPSTLDSVLQEGSVLWVRMLIEATDDEAKKNQEEFAKEYRTVPLGKVVEVFGPVSQPLYSIRLPEATAKNESGVSPPKDQTNEKQKQLPCRREKQAGTKISSSSTEGAIIEGETIEPNVNSKGPDEISVHPQLDLQDANSHEQGNSNNGSAEPESSRSATTDSSIKPRKESLVDYANFLKDEIQQKRNSTIYYIPNDNSVNVLNIQQVYQNSGRGCDASNVYDEEVLNPNEMYFSDDEKERMATGSGRKKNRKAPPTSDGNDSNHNRTRMQSSYRGGMPAGGRGKRGGRAPRGPHANPNWNRPGGRGHVAPGFHPVSQNFASYPPPPQYYLPQYSTHQQISNQFGAYGGHFNGNTYAGAGYPVGQVQQGQQFQQPMQYPQYQFQQPQQQPLPPPPQPPPSEQQQQQHEASDTIYYDYS